MKHFGLQHRSVHKETPYFQMALRRRQEQGLRSI
jgi:hypothetical protein